MIRRTLGAILGLVLLSSFTPITAAAGSPTAVITPSQMLLTLPPPTPAGADFIISGTLASAGQPVAGALVYLFIDGTKRAEKRTDATGAVHFHRVGNIGSGTYEVTLTFRGDHHPADLVRPGPASASGTLGIINDGITLTLPDPTPAGRKLMINAALFGGGAPTPGADLLLYVNGVQVRRARTDSAGTGHFALAGDLAAGSYVIIVRYLGHRRAHGSGVQSIFAIASGSLEILPEGITLHVPPAAAPGQKISLSATMDSGGVPVPGIHLRLLVDGRERRQARTNAQGRASFELLGNLGAGTHRVTVEYLATHRRFSATGPVLASASTTIQIRPLVVAIRTVPPVPGVSFQLDGRVFVSDTTGVARTTVATAGMHGLTVVLRDPDPATHVEFGRWGDDAFAPARQIRVESDVNLDAGLRIAYLTQLKFVGPRGIQLDGAKISDVWLSGPNAEAIHTTYPFPAVWLRTPLPTKRSGADGLYLTPTPYTVSTTAYDGLSVVDRGRELFDPGTTYKPGNSRVWSIPLLLFTMNIHAQDALFGASIARPVLVTDPNGNRRQLQLDREGNAVITVGRGNYTLHVLTGGISPLEPVALSRNKLAIVPIISFVDLAIVGGAMGLTLLCLFLVGRRRSWLGAILDWRPLRRTHVAV
jgi:hypothetical protein